MATISTVTTAIVSNYVVELNKVIRRDGSTSRFEVEFYEDGFGYTFFRDHSEISARSWFNHLVRDLRQGWRP